MGRIKWVKGILEKVLIGDELFFGFVCSQIIRNVPAAILLYGFTQRKVKRIKMWYKEKIVTKKVMKLQIYFFEVFTLNLYNVIIFITKIVMKGDK